MSYEITGTITKIGEIQSFGTKNFTKREVRLTVPDGKYPQLITLEFQGDRCDLPDKYAAGDEVTITFDLRGRLHEASGRGYNTLNAWRITSLGGRTATTPDRQQPAPMSKAGLAQTSLNPADSTDDVPF